MNTTTLLELLAVWASVCASPALFGCARANGENTPDGKASAAASPSAPAPFQIRFSDPGNAGIPAYAKRYGLLERPLAAVNASIVWVPAAGAFSANFDAMNTGAINASGGAVSPVVGALAHQLKFKIFAIGDPSDTKQAGIIVPKGSSIRTVEDLVGKRVAVNWAAHGDYMVLRALERHGVPADKVTRVPIQPPDAAAAFATGKIDAWSTFGVFYTTAVRNGARVLAREADIESEDVTVLAASERALRQGPEAFRVLIATFDGLIEQAHREPEKFQNVFATQGPMAVSGDNLKVAIELTRDTPVFRVPTDVDRSRVGHVATLLFENHSTDRNISVDEVIFDLGHVAAKETGS